MPVGRQRTLVGGPKANELAEFLLQLGSRRDLTTARSFAQQFNGNKSLWAEYLNGSQVIPFRRLRQVVEYVCGTDAKKRELDLAHAKRLHVPAIAEERATHASGGVGKAQVADREMITAHQLLTDAQAILADARDADERARAVIALLLMMCAHAQNSVHHLTEHNSAGHAQIQQRLADARLNLGRTERELKGHAAACPSPSGPGRHCNGRWRKPAAKRRGCAAGPLAPLCVSARTTTLRSGTCSPAGGRPSWDRRGISPISTRGWSASSARARNLRMT